MSKDNQGQPGPDSQATSAPAIKEKGKFGGATIGGGRRPTEKTLDARARVAAIQSHFNEEIPVVSTEVLANGRVVKRTIKKPRTLVALEKLFEIGVKGEGSETALDRWLSRSIGRPVETVEHTGIIKAEEQRPPTHAAIEGVKAYIKALKSEIVD